MRGIGPRIVLTGAAAVLCWACATMAFEIQLLGVGE